MAGIRLWSVDVPSLPVLVRGAAVLLRRESRGAHYHEDYSSARKDMANRTRMTLNQGVALHVELKREPA